MYMYVCMYIYIYIYIYTYLGRACPPHAAAGDRPQASLSLSVVSCLFV